MRSCSRGSSRSSSTRKGSLRLSSSTNRDPSSSTSPLESSTWRRSASGGCGYPFWHRLPIGNDLSLSPDLHKVYLGKACSTLSLEKSFGSHGNLSRRSLVSALKSGNPLKIEINTFEGVNVAALFDVRGQIQG